MQDEDFKDQMLRTIALGGGRLNYYQLDRALASDDGLLFVHRLGEFLKEAQDDSLIEARDDGSGHRRFTITERGRARIADEQRRAA